MVAETEAMLERWASSPQGCGEPFDVHREIGSLTLRIVAKALFGANVGEDAVGRISEAQAFLNGYVDSRMGALPKLPHQVPTPNNTRYRRALKDLELPSIGGYRMYQIAVGRLLNHSESYHVRKISSLLAEALSELAT